MEMLHKKFALSGKMGSGKSTIANEFVKKMGCQKISIGTSIKELTTLVILKDFEGINLFLEVLTSDEARRKNILVQLKEISLEINILQFQKDEAGMFIKNDAYRKLLQRVATFMREQFGETVWVHYLINKNKSIPSIIIDDLRLKTEKDYLEENGFIILRLDIEKEEQVRRLTNIYGEINEEAFHHQTEIDLDNESFFARKDVSKESPKNIYTYFENKLKNKKAS